MSIARIVVSRELKANLTDIKVQDVSTNCILLVSKFSRVLFNEYDLRLKLQDPRVLNKVAAYASSTDDVELNRLYKKIKREIVRHLRKSHPAKYDKVVLRHKKESGLFVESPTRNSINI